MCPEIFLADLSREERHPLLRNRPGSGVIKPPLQHPTTQHYSAIELTLKLENGAWPQAWMWRNTVQSSPKRPLKGRGGIPAREHPVLNNIAILLNSKRKPSLNRPISNDNIKSWITKAPILSIYSKWTSSHWVPSICAIKLMQVVLHQNCIVHQGDSMYLDSFVDLVKVDWINMIPSLFTPKGAQISCLFFLLSHW